MSKIVVFVMVFFVCSCSYIKSLTSDSGEQSPMVITTSDSNSVEQSDSSEVVAVNNTPTPTVQDNSGDTTSVKEPQVVNQALEIANAIAEEQDSSSVVGSVGDDTPIMINQQRVKPNSNMAIISMPLRSNGDSISVRYTVNLPDGFATSDERVKLQPVMVFDTTKVYGESITFQGSGVRNNRPAVPLAIPHEVYKGLATFHYNGTPADRVSFYLVMETTIFSKNKFGSVEQGEHIDTLFQTSGISVIDRLLKIEPFIQTASKSSEILDSITDSISKRLAKRKDISISKKEAIIAEAKAKYMEAIIDNNLGVIAYKEGDRLEAKRLFVRSAALSDILQEPRYNIGLIALEEGDYERFRREIKEGDIVDYINGDYASVLENLSGYNRALAHILLSRLNSASEITEPMNNSDGDMLRLIVHAHRGENEHVDSIMNSRGHRLRQLNGYHIIANEIKIYE